MRPDEQNGQAQTNFGLVLGYIAIKELGTLEQRVDVLARLGYSNRDIAQICDTTPLSVSVRKAGLKKGKKTKGARKKK